MKRKRGSAVALILLGAAALALVAVKLRAPEVTVVRPIRGVAVEAVYGTGVVEAVDRVTVKAKAQGTIDDLLVREGATVKKGDILAKLDNPVLRFELARGNVELSAAQAQAGTSAPQLQALSGQHDAIAAELDQAKLELERIRSLVKSASAPQAEVDRWSSRVRALESSLSANEAQQRSLRIDLTANQARLSAQKESLSSRVEDTIVRAPIDGVILARLVDPGELIAAGQPLFRIGDTRELIVEALIDEADVARISSGDHGPPSRVVMSLYAFGDQTFTGVVTEVFPDAQRIRKSFLTKIKLDAPPPGLRSGMTAEVNIIASQKADALLIPNEAERGGQVWRFDHGKLVPTNVETGIRDLNSVEVVAGLDPAALVFVGDASTLSPGQRARAAERPFVIKSTIAPPKSPGATL